jgi:hypothetical protein
MESPVRKKMRILWGKATERHAIFFGKTEENAPHLLQQQL